MRSSRSRNGNRMQNSAAQYQPSAIQYQSVYSQSPSQLPAHQQFQIAGTPNVAPIGPFSHPSAATTSAGALSAKPKPTTHTSFQQQLQQLQQQQEQQHRLLQQHQLALQQQQQLYGNAPTYSDQVQNSFYNYQQQRDQYDQQQRQLLQQLYEIYPQTTPSQFQQQLQQQQQQLQYAQRQQQYAPQQQQVQQPNHTFYTAQQHAEFLQQQQHQIYQQQQQNVQQLYTPSSTAATPTSANSMFDDAAIATAGSPVMGAHHAYSPSTSVSHVKYTSGNLNYNF